MNKQIASLCLLSLLVISLPAGAYNKQDPLGLPGASTALWYRYYGAGETALKQKDEQGAKKYWMAALDEIEKSMQFDSKDRFRVVRLSALEERLTEMYPENLSKDERPENERLKLQQEQVSVLGRIAKINERLIPKDLLATKSKERFENARTELEKTLAASKNKAAEKSATTSR